MKVKRKKKLNLHELIKYVYENELFSTRWMNSFAGVVYFNDIGKFSTDDRFISPEGTFTVETEEEVSQLTEFKKMVVLLNNGKIVILMHTNIKEILLDDATALYTPVNGKLVCVWEENYGIPEDGILEVD